MEKVSAKSAEAADLFHVRKCKNNIDKLGKIMFKKVVVMAIAILIGYAMPSFAEGNKTSKAERIEMYDFDVNINRLSSYLELSSDQEGVMETIMSALKSDMLRAAMVDSEEERAALTDKAVKRNISYVRAVLSGNQVRKYLRVMNATLVNKGINKAGNE